MTKLLLFLGGLLLFATLFWTTHPLFIHDEQHHAHAIREVAQMLTGQAPFDLNYSQTGGPLFYLMTGTLESAGLSWSWLRGFVFLFACANCVLFARVCRISLTAASVVLASGPWLLLSSMTVHTEHVALFFLLLACSALARSDRPSTSIYPAHLFGCSMLAIAIRPYFLFMPAAMALTLWRQGTHFIRIVLISGMLFLPLAVLYAVWGGMIPPLARATWSGLNVDFDPRYLFRPFSVLGHAGLYCLPLLVALHGRALADRWKSNLGLLSLSTVIALLIPLGSAGPLDSLMRALTNSPSQTPFVSMSESHVWLRPIYAVGLSAALWACVILKKSLLEKHSVDFFCISGLALYSISVVFTGPLFVERYMVPAYLLLALPLTNRREKEPNWFFYACATPFLLVSLAHTWLK